jgi:hypothetical protein
MFYSYKNTTPIKSTEIPERIRLSNRLTRTDKSTFTDEELLDAGYVIAPDRPSFNFQTEKLIWADNNWHIIPLTPEEQADLLAKE